MCGIAGFAGTGDRAIAEAMTRKLGHRGPDGSGVHVDAEAHVFLGHTRLAIIDLATGQQPMWNEDGQVGLVFNGEIYNHVELRRELTALGHRFATSHSDTEVVVHGYEQWGEAVLERLNGMFAFALYDRPRRRLFLARDRFGEKPLYYASTPDAFVFASELTALACHPAVDRSLDERALRKFFAYGYIPAPAAILQGAHKLPAGHYLMVDLASGACRASAYWRFRLEPDDGLDDADENRLVDELQHLIEQAVRRRLISDVPLGIFLSGGIDSSTLLGAATASRAAGDLKTFTIGFTEPSFDESVPAGIVARHFGTQHHERMLDLDTARALIPEVLAKLDEPLGDASILPTYLLSRFVREHVTVALSGDGGDELFAGYDPFLALNAAETYGKVVPPWLHRGMRSLASLMPVSDRNMSLDFKVKRTLMGLSYPTSFRLPVWMAPLEPKELAEFLETPVDPREVYSEAIELWEGNPTKHIVDRAMEFFTVFYLQDDILMKVDRAAMMNSLESRAVFLDNDLVDFCRRLPNRFKFRNGERKYLLKQVARRMLPAGIVDRKKKGFGIPLSKWLRQLPPQAQAVSSLGVGGDYARLAWSAHKAGRSDNRLFLWSLLSAQHVMAQFQGDKAA